MLENVKSKLKDEEESSAQIQYCYGLFQIKFRWTKSTDIPSLFVWNYQLMRLNFVLVVEAVKVFKYINKKCKRKSADQLIKSLVATSVSRVHRDEFVSFFLYDFIWNI